MKLDKLNGPIDAPSFGYLSKSKDFTQEEKKILQFLANKNYPKVVSELVSMLEKENDSEANFRFIACIIDQLCKSDKKQTPASITNCCLLEVLTANQKKFLERFLIQINSTLNHQSIIPVTNSTANTVLSQLVEYSNKQEEELTDSEKSWFILYHTAQLNFQKGYFLRVLAECRQILEEFPEKAVAITDILEQSWQLVEGLKLGILLRMRTQRVSSRDTKLLAVEKPTITTPLNSLCGSEKEVSYRYLSNYQQFGAIERGIIYNIVKRDYPLAVYSILKKIENQEEEQINWYFFLCIIDQLAKANNLKTSQFVQDTLSKEKSAASKWFNDIKSYFEYIQRSLLDKTLPDISVTVNAKATDLTNKLQVQQKANWSKKEWQATFHRAQAWVYIRKGYYLATYEAAIRAKELADGSEKGIEKYLKSCKRFKEAKDLGKAMGKNKINTPKHANEIRYAFQASESPTIPPKLPSSIIDQLLINVDIGTFEKFSMDGPNSVIIKGANDVGLSTILTKLSTRIITKINLQDCTFSQRLPDRLFEFKNLRFLTITDCHLDRIPTDLGKLMHLSYLSLSKLSPIDTLPESLTKLNQLTKLHLSLKNLTSLPVNFQNLTQLSHLTITDTKSFNFPLAICDLLNLEYLNLKGNQYTHLPSKISQLKNLKDLYLQDNPWKILPISLLDITALHYFQIKSTEIDALEVAEEVKVALREQLSRLEASRRFRNDFYRHMGK